MNEDTGSIEASMIDNNHRQFTGKELSQILLGNTIVGDFGAVFKYIMTIGSDGALEGINNVGSHHIGQLSIDEEANTMTVVWHDGWENTTSRAYDVDGKIKLYNIENCQWSTTFFKVLTGVDYPMTPPI